MQRIILHIDFDSFFASVEQQYNPLLRGKPIGVTATNGRTCIIASSREAKAKGVKTATRTVDALRMCPDIKLVSADFWKYWEVSKKFVKICSDFSPFIEIFSIDELFIDATACAHLYGGVEGLVTQLRKRIRIEIGEYITVSIGVSHNKLLAKLGSDLKKPNGMTVITPSNLEGVYGVCKLTDICGIGTRINIRLNNMGIYTLLQLRKTSKAQLIGEFGMVEGAFLYDVGQGEDVRPVMAFNRDPGVKSVGRQYCLPHNEHDQRAALQNVYELFEEVAFKLRRLGKKARSSGVWIAGSYNAHGHVTQTRYTDSGPELFALAMQSIFDQHGELPVGYVRRIGVWAGYLEDSAHLPSPLFLKEQRQDVLQKTVDQLNERFGSHTLRNGFLLHSADLTTAPNGWMADRYERRKLAESF